MGVTELVLLLLVALLLIGVGRIAELVGRFGRWARPSTKSQSRNAKVGAFAFAFAAACTVALALTILASRAAH
jgi:hypothetical protein